jgi:hypothetical protein
MSNQERLDQLIAHTISIFVETRRRTSQERADAERELRCYLSPLVKSSDGDHSLHLIAKGLRHLRELEGRPAPILTQSQAMSHVQR